MTTTLSPKAALSDEAQCRSVLSKCDSALKAVQEVNSLQAQIIKDQEARFQEQEKQINSASIWKPIALGGAVVIVLETLLLVFKK